MTAFCFLLVELLLADSGADAGARAIGADADGGFAWSGRRRWCRRRSSAASYRVIDNDRKFRSTDSGGALQGRRSTAVRHVRWTYPVPTRTFHTKLKVGSKACLSRPPCPRWVDAVEKVGFRLERVLQATKRLYWRGVCALFAFDPT